MKAILIYSLLLVSVLSFAQEKEPPQDVQYIYKGNQQLHEDNFVDAEAEYRNAISENPVNAVSKFNLGNAYFKNKKTDEALMRYHEAQKVAETKADKHKAFHNIGNSFMQKKDYARAIEAYKNALRNNPKDDESRYNLAFAKEKKKEQDKEDDKNKDNNKDQQNQKDNKDKKDNKDDKNKNDKDSDKKEDEGKEDDKKNSDNQDDKEKDKKQDDNGKEDDKKDKQDDKQQDKSDQKKQDKPKQQPGQLSPQQVQSLLDAMNNQEKKLQEKMNAKKAKGVPVKNEKDW
ncbi:MAG: tetratricopeptide repeat protein [Flavobacteriaceae bacterium]